MLFTNPILWYVQEGAKLALLTLLILTLLTAL